MAQTSAVPLIGFFASVRKHSAESFAKRHPDPVFLFSATVTTDAAQHFVTTEATAAIELQRTKGTEAGRLGVEQRACPIKKSARNAVMPHISIGRGLENDVVIEEPTVSKEHAFLERVGEVWTLVDMDSANGTIVQGVRLPANGSAPLTDGVEISLGSCQMRFLMPASFHAYIAKLLG
jgi:hypothetical protein